ncbi:hypothetical protein [Cardiobacterium hominis]|jgi:lipoprotein|uniref:hypothetical protein n=1 Tax=Cardiobacterium hominis TaxID=2718 RepID=UPI0028EF2805|nr:hypothetical protein [Cardiobacterium hominis]
MKKLATLAMMGSLLAACNSDPLDDIKNAKIERYDVTWAAAVEKLSACKPGTQKWNLQAKRKSNEEAVFECEMTESAIKPYNDKLEENAKISASVLGNKTVSEITTARLILQITHWRDTDDGLLNEIDPKITIQYSKPNEKHEHLRVEKKYILDKELVEKIIAQNKNPIEQILPNPPIILGK